MFVSIQEASVDKFLNRIDFSNPYKDLLEDTATLAPPPPSVFSFSNICLFDSRKETYFHLCVFLLSVILPLDLSSKAFVLFRMIPHIGPSLNAYH